MSTRFVVTQISTCPKCKGAGVVQHPAWEEYWADPIHDVKASMSPEHDLRWFTGHGWMETPLDRLPDEEITCDECDGMKLTRTEVDLFTALNSLEKEMIKNV